MHVAIVFNYLETKLSKERTSETLHQVAQKRKSFPINPVAKHGYSRSAIHRFSHNLLTINALAAERTLASAEVTCGNRLSLCFAPLDRNASIFRIIAPGPFCSAANACERSASAYSIVSIARTELHSPGI